MHQTIYFGLKPLFLGTEITEEIKSLAEDKATILVEDANPESVQTIINKIQQPETKAGIVLSDNPGRVLELIKRQCTVVQAAGGLVHTEEGELLLIFRRGKWDLPKGKLDAGESLEICAVREVGEETGLEKVQMQSSLCITYHTYYEKGLFILKESHWYLMTTRPGQIFRPQTEEDIQICEWVKFERIAPYLENMQPSVINVIKEGLRQLGKSKVVD